MTENIFIKNEIDLFLSKLSKLKKDFTDIVLIGDEKGYLYSLLKENLPNCDCEKARDFCLLAVICDSDDEERLIDEAEKLLSLKNCKKCVICTCNSLKLSEKAFSVAEREYMFLSDEKLVPEKAKIFSKKIPTTLLVFDKIISPDFGLESELNFENDIIEISTQDSAEVFGYTYIRDVLSAVLMSFENLKRGNIYNVSSFAASVAEIKKKIHSLFCEKFSLKCDISSQKNIKYKSLSPLKIKSLGFEMTNIDDALYLIACSRFGITYDYSKVLFQYCGKLELLRNAELLILDEIDRICKKHDIKYFLTGGTLLGAVRYGKIIPWDDDIDIGMLRPDFEKFRAVAPAELDKKFAYASHTSEENCHYLFDKVRLKNTYFSTSFSSAFKIQDGLFVDIFVYDKTSDSEKNQKMQINLIKSAIRLLNIKWTRRADRGMNGYVLSLLVKPFVKLIPFKYLHYFAEKVLRLYDKKDRKYLIDGTGLNIVRGAFDKSYLDKMTEIDFEGRLLPVPEKYDEFLTHIYGENYISEPTVDKRIGTHGFVRLDLGEYAAFKTEILSEQSLDGELY